MLPEGYRFRSGFRGRLVLQRRKPQRIYSSMGGYVDSRDEFVWSDATTEDLVHFFSPSKPQQESNHAHSHQ